MVGVDEVRYGIHREIRYLPKKIANILHEFTPMTFLASDCLRFHQIVAT